MWRLERSQSRDKDYGKFFLYFGANRGRGQVYPEGSLHVVAVADELVGPYEEAAYDLAQAHSDRLHFQEGWKKDAPV